MNTWGVHTPVLTSKDVRAMFTLVGELRELGDDPPQWRAHFARGLSSLCACRAAVAMEITSRPSAQVVMSCPSCSAIVALVDDAAAGVTRSETSRFYDDVLWFDHTTDRTLDAMMPLYGSDFTRSRAALVDDAAWYRSALANEKFRPNDCDDFITSMTVAPLATLTISSVMLYRGWGDPAFTERESTIIEVLHAELARDFAYVPGDSVKLTPRAREVLTCLVRGDSEKEIAAALALSLHTVHDHVKAIHRAFRVRSRGELLSRVARDTRKVVRLVSGNPPNPGG